MINLLVVAGSASEKLTAFLENRGTFDVRFCYNSLYENVSAIQNQIIKTDKMLYLYQVDEETGSSTINIKSDMQVLRSLIKASGFFEPGEIVFITGKSAMSERAVQFFTTVMKECGRDNYSIEILEGKLTFSAVYDSLMGVSATKDFKNTYRSVYRVERNSDADLAYVGANDKELIIEPFRYDDLSNYEMRKASIVQTDSGYVNVDKDDGQKKFDNPDFKQLQFKNVLGRRKVVIVTGGGKSGKTMWTAALGRSASAAGKTTCILDLTKSSDIENIYRGMSFAVNSVRMLDLVKNFSTVPGQIYTCCVHSKNEESVKIEFLQNFFSRETDLFDVVFVLIDAVMLNAVHVVLQNEEPNVLLLTTAVMQDVINLQDVVVGLGSNRCRVTVILNENLRLFQDTGFVPAEEVKEVLGGDVRVVKPVFFDNLDVGSNIYNAIVR